MKPNSKQRGEIDGVKNWGKSGSGRLKNAIIRRPDPDLHRFFNRRFCRVV